nr:hypothetical protein [Tanacetum cinerariifolium]
MDDPNITIEEYIKLEAEKARSHSFPAIVYKDILAPDREISSEPTISPHHKDRIDFEFIISFDESDDEDSIVSYDKNLFSYKLTSVIDLIPDSDNDQVEINISSKEIAIEPSDSVVDTNFDAQSYKFKESFEMNHDIRHKSFIMEDYFTMIKVMIQKRFYEGMPLIFIIKNLYVPFGIPFDPKRFYKDDAYMKNCGGQWRLERIYDRQVHRVHALDFDTLTEEMRGALADRLGETWTWVASGPERKQDVAAGVVQVDQKGLEEGDQARMARLEEEVHGLRESLGEQRVVLDAMRKDFSRFGVDAAKDFKEYMLNQMVSGKDSSNPLMADNLPKIVNGVTRLQALVDKKKVIITEATIRDALRLDDAESIDCLPNEEIFTELSRMGLVMNVDSSTKFYMYPRFLQLLIRAQVGDLSLHSTKYSSPSLTQKMFANMRRIGKGFSRVDTPLSEGMIVAHQDDGVADEGAASVAVDDVPAAVDEPSIPSPTPTTQPPPPSQDLPSTLQVQPISPPSPIAQ